MHDYYVNIFLEFERSEFRDHAWLLPERKTRMEEKAFSGFAFEQSYDRLCKQLGKLTADSKWRAVQALGVNMQTSGRKLFGMQTAGKELLTTSLTLETCACLQERDIYSRIVGTSVGNEFSLRYCLRT